MRHYLPHLFTHFTGFSFRSDTNKHDVSNPTLLLFNKHKMFFYGNAQQEKIYLPCYIFANWLHLANVFQFV